MTNDQLLQEFILNLLNEKDYSADRAEKANTVLDSFLNDLDDTKNIEDVNALTSHLNTLSPFIPEYQYTRQKITNDINQRAEAVLTYDDAVHKAKSFLRGYTVGSDGQLQTNDVSKALFAIMNGDRDQIAEYTKNWDYHTVANLYSTFYEIDAGLKLGSPEKDGGLGFGSPLDGTYQGVDHFSGKTYTKGFLKEWGDLRNQVDALMYDAAFYKPFERVDKDGDTEIRKVLPLLLAEEIPLIIDAGAGNDKWRDDFEKLRNGKIKIAENSYYSSEKQKQRVNKELFRISKDFNKTMNDSKDGLELITFDDLINEDGIPILTDEWLGNSELLFDKTDDEDSNSSDVQDGFSTLSTMITNHKNGKASEEDVINSFNAYVGTLKNEMGRLDKSKDFYNAMSMKWNGNQLATYDDAYSDWIVKDDGSIVDNDKNTLNATFNGQLLNDGEAMGFDKTNFMLNDISNLSAQGFVNYTANKVNSDSARVEMSNPMDDSRLNDFLNYADKNYDNINIDDPHYNPKVKDLQKFLAEQGYLNSNGDSIDIDGLFGHDTSDALNDFLHLNGEPTVPFLTEKGMFVKDMKSDISSIFQDLMYTGEDYEAGSGTPLGNKVLNQTIKDMEQ